MSFSRVQVETRESIEEKVLGRLRRMIDNSEVDSVRLMLDYPVEPAVKKQMEELLLEARLGELTSDEKRQLEIVGQLMLLARAHAERVADPNYGRHNNNRLPLSLLNGAGRR